MEGLISYNGHINIGACLKHIKLQNYNTDFLSDKYSANLPGWEEGSETWYNCVDFFCRQKSTQIFQNLSDPFLILCVK